MFYKINEVSKLTGISAYTLRYYEKEGILPPIERNEAGRRIYTEENLKWIELVTCFKKTKMPVSNIKEIVRLSIIGETTIEDRKKILLNHKKDMQEQLKELIDGIEKIDKKIAFYNGSKECD